MTTARAMVFDGPDRPLRLHKMDLPAPAAGELLVSVAMTTLCGSDVHTFQGHRSTPCPTVLGHEVLGIVAALPPGESLTDALNQPLTIGDRVTWSVVVHCGHCFFCRHNLPQKCEQLFKYGHEQLQPRHAPSGGLADVCHLKAGTTVFRVPDELDDRVACPANCATATVAAALQAAGNCEDSVVLIQGCGMLGLTASAMARSSGAREVIVCDVDKGRLQRAKQFGATHAVAIEHSGNRLQQVVAETTAGRGVDVALEMSGSPEAVETGIDLLRTGGRFIWIGAVFPARPVSLFAEKVVRKMLTIQGIHNYAPSHLADALTFLRLHHGEFPFATLVSKSFQLSEANAAFKFAAESGALRVAVCPD